MPAVSHRARLETPISISAHAVRGVRIPDLLAAAGEAVSRIGQIRARAGDEAQTIVV